MKVLDAYLDQSGQWNFLDATVAEQLPRLWYRYYYDARKRLISKEVPGAGKRSEEHTSELQSLTNLVCRLLLEKKKNK